MFFAHEWMGFSSKYHLQRGNVSSNEFIPCCGLLVIHVSSYHGSSTTDTGPVASSSLKWDRRGPGKFTELIPVGREDDMLQSLFTKKAQVVETVPRQVPASNNGTQSS